LDVEDEQLQFMDDAFGETVHVETYLDDAITIMKRDEARAAGKSLHLKKLALKSKKAEFKE